MDVERIPSFCWVQKTHLNIKDRQTLGAKGWKKMFKGNGAKKQAGGAILISAGVDLKPKLVKKDRERHCTLVKERICQEDIAILNFYDLSTKEATF